MNALPTLQSRALAWLLLGACVDLATSSCAPGTSTIDQTDVSVGGQLSVGGSSADAGGAVATNGGAVGDAGNSTTAGGGMGGNPDPGSGGVGTPTSGGSAEGGGATGRGGSAPGSGGTTVVEGSGGTTSSDGGSTVTGSGGGITGGGGTISGDGGANIGGGMPDCSSGQVWCYGACRKASDCFTMSGGASNNGGTAGDTSSMGGFQGTSEYCGGGTVYDGQATWYILGESMPNCSYPAAEVVGNYAAINTQQYATAATCGACIEATRGAKSVVVQVVDQCPTCDPGTNHIDMSQAAFEQLDDLSVGKMDITWRFVECPESLITATMEYAIKDGSSPNWTAIAFRNYPVPITGVSVKNRMAKVSTPTRMEYNYWLTEEGFGLGPYTVTVTNANSQSITFTMPPLVDGALTGTPVFESTGVQFAPCSE